LFRNSDGTIRFALVVDDFAVVWSSKKAMKHFLQTLRKLYTIKVDYHGLRYLGIDIHIDRKNRQPVTRGLRGWCCGCRDSRNHRWNHRGCCA
jgi:hypothetical protein